MVLTIGETGLTETRVATAEDEPWMFELYRCVFEEHISQIWGWHDDWQTADFKQGLLKADCHIIELHGERIGFLRTSGVHDLELQLLALKPEYQCRGLGTAVIEELKQRCHRITLKVFSTNKPARRLYRKLGFRDNGSDKEFYSMLWQETGRVRQPTESHLGDIC